MVRRRVSVAGSEDAVESPPMMKATADFLGYLAERGASFNTIAAYRSDLQQLVLLSGMDPAEPLDRDTLDRFVARLRSRGYSDASIARKLAAARSFFSFLTADGTLAVDPTVGFELPKVARTLPRPISAQDVDKLLAQPALRSTPAAKRDQAMLELLHATGMRVSELVSLDVADIDLDRKSPRVRCGAGHGEERTILIPKRARKALLDYLEEGRPRLPRRENEQALFLNRRGGRLTRQGVWIIIKTYTRAAALSEDITPHTFRHSFAAHMLGDGMPLSNVQKMLGHSALSSTRFYDSFRPSGDA